MSTSRSTRRVQARDEGHASGGDLGHGPSAPRCPASTCAARPERRRSSRSARARPESSRSTPGSSASRPMANAQRGFARDRLCRSGRERRPRRDEPARPIAQALMAEYVARRRIPRCSPEANRTLRAAARVSTRTRPRCVPEIDRRRFRNSPIQPRAAIRRSPPRRSCGGLDAGRDRRRGARHAGPVRGGQSSPGCSEGFARDRVAAGRFRETPEAVGVRR